jgi:type I restriction enzyme M protein
MLDNETKRKIDSARSILVGKVPDPKAQVEQITTALIYKFMDDMDRESEELGGIAKFVIGELDSFKWAKLMSKELGGEARLILYTQALTAFSKAEGIPEIFRTIFKDAFLPYRDPETLNLFLKEIDYFDYDHSENLGDAFEYLLSVLGSQGDAGQFRTPRHIIDFIVEVLEPKKSDTILDPSCGTAGFLISAYKHISANENLSHDDKKQLMHNFTGYDISPDMVRLSLVNMYLHSFPQPKIYEYDTLTSEDRWNDSFDVILANPPFMTPKGGIRPHSRFSVQANRSEVLFVDYIAEHLNLNGRAGIIVPEGIIFQSANAYKSLRKMLVENGFLWAVVSLPAGVFQPYSGVKTSILLLDRTIAKQNDSVLFVKISNDGYDLGAQRREIAHNDLIPALDVIKNHRKGETVESPIAQLVLKTKIVESGDYNLTGERYKETKAHEDLVYPLVKLGDICDVRDGTHDSPKYQTEGFPLITSKNIIDGKINFENVNLISKEDLDKVNKRSFVEDGDIIMPMIGTIGNPIVVKKDREFAIKNVALIKFNQDGKINRYYLQAILNSQFFKNHFENSSSGVTQKFISLRFIRELEIPLPPLEIQNAIVAEIEKEQQEIAECKRKIEMHEAKIKRKIGEVWGEK